MPLNPDLHTFRDTIRRISPPWLQGFWGYRLMYSLAIPLDAFGDGLVASIKLRFPNVYSAETLPLIGRERGIRRGPDETDEGYAVRQRDWWEAHRHRGNPYNLLGRVLVGYLTPHLVKMREVNNAGAWYTRNADGTTEYHFASPWNWNWDNDTFHWSRIWVIIYPPADLWTNNGAWGAGDAWGPNTFGQPSWGSSATPEQVTAIRELITEWHAAHARCVNIVVAFDDTKFDPAGGPANYPDGSWALGYRLDGSGHQIPTREPTAIYWKGDD